MFIQIAFLLLLIQGYASAVDKRAQHHHNLPENTQARELFSRADRDGNHQLSTQEMHLLFLDFDLNNDTYVTSDEFLKDWIDRGLGDPMDGVVLFNHLDVDKNGEIHESVDLPWILRFFDHDYNGSISEAEFVTQWVKMMNTHYK